MIVDGGLGLELERRGFVFATRLWSGEAVTRDPDLLVDIHGAYLDAGAEVLATATYQLSHATLRELGYDDAAIDGVFARAVALAREAVARRGSAALVAASLGPYGATVGDGSEYTATQHLERAALHAFHAERLRAVVAAAPDVIMFETIPTRTEALVIADVVRDLGLAGVWLSLSCADGERTFGGDRVAALAAELDPCAGIAVIGVNCTAPAAIAPLIRALQTATAKPIAVCPNLGQHWQTASHALAGGASAAEFLRGVPEWLELGVAHIGGCCGVGPETIAALAAIAGERAVLESDRS